MAQETGARGMGSGDSEPEAAAASLPVQVTLTEDYGELMSVPSVIAVESTPLHTYILSESDGLLVFRNSADSLQWMYTSSGMQRRGYKLSADARFAYLHGNGTRLSVVEPTSVLGVYSSTDLPAAPVAVARTGTLLWVAMGDHGLGALTLESPESVDAEPAYPHSESFESLQILDLASDPSSHLFVLTRDRADGSRQLHVVESVDISQSRYAARLTLDRQLDRLHLVSGELFASNAQGDLYRLREDGSTEFVSGFGVQPDKIRRRGETLFVRTLGGKLWVGGIESGFAVARGEAEAGNFVGVSHHGVYLSQYGRVTPVSVTETASEPTAGIDVEAQGEPGDAASGAPRLVPIPDQVIPYPKPLILPIRLERSMASGQVDFALIGGADNAVVRGRSFYWQPRATQNGRHTFTLLATSNVGLTDTTSFRVDVRPFNAPPRFVPIRPVTIPVQEAFTTRFEATDPDGMDSGFIRYMGVDLPEGSRIDENTGTFDWSPELRHAGQHAFRVIATDQFGAASAIDVTIRVADLLGPQSGESRP